LNQLSEVTDRAPRQVYTPQSETSNASFVNQQQQYLQPYQPVNSFFSQPSQPMQQTLQPQAQATYQFPILPQSGQQSLLFPVAEQLVGGLIGKKGSNIAEIRQRSGAHIKIPEAEPNQHERVLQISGTPEANELAIRLIHQKLQTILTGPRSY